MHLNLDEWKRMFPLLEGGAASFTVPAATARALLEDLEEALQPKAQEVINGGD